MSKIRNPNPPQVDKSETVRGHFNDFGLKRQDKKTGRSFKASACFEVFLIYPPAADKAESGLFSTFPE
jgi:hypothetical protein